MKRLTIVCLLMLLSLILATTAFASPRPASQRTGGLLALTPGPAMYGPSARIGTPAPNPSRAYEPAKKASPVTREIAPNQEIGDGKCFEYVIFEIWHVWAGCGSSGGGSGGGW